MAAGKRKRDYTIYILPLLFCLVLAALVLLKGQSAEPAPAKMLQAGEPLTLTDQAIENYLYSDGFTLLGEAVQDAHGQKTATLTVSKGEDGKISSLTLTFSLPTYCETENSHALPTLKANRDAAIQRGETLFLALFDAISATDGRVAPRRDSALSKLRQTLDTGKASTQAANSWRFSFSLAPGDIESTATILFTLVK